VRVLVDTHVWLWMSLSPERLLPTVRELLARSDTDRLLSIASCWEIAIKYGTGKLKLPSPPEEYLPTRMVTSAVSLLPISLTHVGRVASLEAHHGDPFDRMLIAQAQVEELSIVTRDRRFEPYGVRLILT
jgi:PIN domain nuclease of toxin-antitoxin system